MRRSLVVGNWKMHGSSASVNTLVTGLKELLTEADLEQAQMVVCPPSVYLSQVADSLKGGNIAWGAQTVSKQPEGAFTGEISPSMLADFNCKYVIVGHSERRTLFAENNQLVADKFIAAQNAELIPILCVGESLQQREAGETLSWVKQQLMVVINTAGIEALAKAVVAYEPIWAIGTGKTASPEQAQEVHAYIRSVVAAFDPNLAEDLQLLYGGSVKAANAAELFAKQDIDGALVGGAALNAAEFAAIYKAAI